MNVDVRKVFVDATNRPIGRLANEVARHLLNKDYPFECRTFVFIRHLDKVNVKDNYLITHSGYIGNLKKVHMREVLTRRPLNLLHRVLRCMLPKNITGKQMLNRVSIDREQI